MCVTKYNASNNRQTVTPGSVCSGVCGLKRAADFTTALLTRRTLVRTLLVASSSQVQCAATKQPTRSEQLVRCRAPLQRRRRVGALSCVFAGSLANRNAAALLARWFTRVAARSLVCPLAARTHARRLAHIRRHRQRTLCAIARAHSNWLSQRVKVSMTIAQADNNTHKHIYTYTHTFTFN